MGTEIMSEDGKTITLFDEDKGEFSADKEGDKGGEQKPDLDTLLETDIATLPEEHRDLFKNLIGSLKEQAANVNLLTEKSALVEQLLQKSNFEGASKEKIEKEVKGLADSLTFEEKDYYAPFFKQLAVAIDNIEKSVSDLRSSGESDKVTTFQNKVKTFFKDNKLDQTIIQKMDEIASGSPAMYNNLDRLCKFAKLELGIKDAPPVSKKENIIEGGHRKIKKTITEPKTIGSMKDAFDQAKEELANRE